MSGTPDEQVKHLTVAVVVVFDGPLMLVNRRPDGSYYGGWWEWPGGKVEPGETPEACARRELDEEIGIEAEGLRLFERAKARYPGRVVELHVFTARRKKNSQPHANALEHQWLEPGAVRELKFLEPNLPVLERMIAALDSGRLR